MSALGPDDIKAFAEDAEEALKAAQTYVKRRNKGLPPDRWYDGHNGAELVAKGIVAQSTMIELLSGAFIQMWNEKVQQAHDATRVHPAHSKYKRE